MLLITGIFLLWAVEHSHLWADAPTAVNLRWYVYEAPISCVHPLACPWDCITVTWTTRTEGASESSALGVKGTEDSTPAVTLLGSWGALPQPSKCHLWRCRFSEHVSANSELSIVSQTSSVPKWNSFCRPPPTFFFSFQWHNKQNYAVFFQLGATEMRCLLLAFR